MTGVKGCAHENGYKRSCCQRNAIKNYSLCAPGVSAVKRFRRRASAVDWLIAFASFSSYTRGQSVSHTKSRRGETAAGVCRGGGGRQLLRAEASASPAAGVHRPDEGQGKPGRGHRSG